MSDEYEINLNYNEKSMFEGNGDSQEEAFDSQEQNLNSKLGDDIFGEDFSNLPNGDGGSFEDDIDLDKEFNFDDIDALQEKIKQSIGFGESEEAKEEKQEEDDIDSSVLKKYIVYISTDFVPLLDELSINELSAYVNDAIQKKLDLEEEERRKDDKKRIATNIIIIIITTIIMTPILLYAAHKSLMATFENYKYSQDNFEKLYQQRFKKDKIYMRSLKYSKVHTPSSKKKE